MQELLLVLIWLQKKKEYFYTEKASVITMIQFKLLFTYLLNFYTFFLVLCLFFNSPLGPRLVAPFWSWWRGCQGHSSAPGVLHEEEHGADGFFFLTPLSFLLSLPPPHVWFVFLTLHPFRPCSFLIVCSSTLH